jgi:hypothetical protein
VPNGHYVLIIGSNNTTDATWATVHDNVMLTGGVVALTAPTLVAVPTYTPPATETSGSYRLAHLDPAAEAPCLQAFNADRASNGLPAAVEDEWLTENVRANQSFFFSATFAGTLYPLSSGGVNGLGGTGACSQTINSAFPVNPYAMSVQTLWFGGSETTQVAEGRGSQISTMAQFVVDPRASTDPNYPTWP